MSDVVFGQEIAPEVLTVIPDTILVRPEPQLRFSTRQYGDFWTGAGASAGVYYYYWRYSTDCDPVERTVKGTVTLMQ